jgi:ribonuclease HI
LRNNRGSWIHGFSRSCGKASNLVAELSAIWKGLQLTWNLGYKSIIMESDSQAALDLIANCLILSRMNFILMQLYSHLLESSLLFLE